MKRLSSGYWQVRYVNSNGNEKYEIVIEEIEKFNKLIEGHKKLLIAIGGL